jgi:hypothetical protein
LSNTKNTNELNKQERVWLNTIPFLFTKVGEALFCERILWDEPGRDSINKVTDPDLQIAEQERMLLIN